MSSYKAVLSVLSFTKLTTSLRAVIYGTIKTSFSSLWRPYRSTITSDHLGRCEDLVRARALHNFAACSSTNGESLDSG